MFCSHKLLGHYTLKLVHTSVNIKIYYILLTYYLTETIVRQHVALRKIF